MPLSERGLIWSQEAERFSESDGSAAIIHAELAIDIVRMHLDGSRRDHQFSGNLLVCEVLVEQVQNLQFAVGQRFQTFLLQ